MAFIRLAMIVAKVVLPEPGIPLMAIMRRAEGGIVRNLAVQIVQCNVKHAALNPRYIDRKTGDVGAKRKEQTHTTPSALTFRPDLPS
jgi:hypothetical protein